MPGVPPSWVLLARVHVVSTELRAGAVTAAASHRTLPPKPMLDGPPVRWTTTLAAGRQRR
jgi:hypothetical protein